MECVYGENIHKPLEKHSHKDHVHEHGHNHSHASTNKKVLSISFFITIAAMIFQFIYSIITNSLALMSDTLHMLSHVIALGLSWFAIYAATNWQDKKKTFGYHRLEVIVALVNSITIGIFGILIVYEAVLKIINPEPIEIGMMLVVASIGLIINIATGLLMLKGDMKNINIRSSFVHMMSDLLSSVAIVVGGIVVYYTNFWWIDALLALIIAIVIGKWSYSLARDSINVLLESSPLNIESVKEAISENNFVRDVHDLHISEITHNFYILTAHIAINFENINKFDEIVMEISTSLEKKFNIGHVTLQPEWK